MIASTAASLVSRFIAANGEQVIISRIIDAHPTPPKRVSTAPISAFVRNYRLEEIFPGSGIAQGDSLVSLPGDALDQMRQLQMPGGVTMNVPRKGDKIQIRGRERNIEGVAPISIGGSIVRIDLTVKG